jgi:hypothetical protein
MWLPARTINMSISGVLFRTAEPPAPAVDLEMRILMEAPPDRPIPATVIQVSGRVVRQDMTVQGAVAVEFQSGIRSVSDPEPEDSTTLA